MRPLFVLFTSALLLPCAWTAPIADDETPDAVALDAQVETLAQARAANKAAFFLKIRNQLDGPVRIAGAAGNFIIDCVRKVQYEGRPGGNAQFAEWKKNNRDLFSNRDFERAADLHLRYLALTLKRATLDSVEPVLQEVWDYLDLLSKSQELLLTVQRDPAQVKIRVYDEKKREVSGEIVGQMQDTRLASADNVRGYVQDLLNGGVNAGLAAQALKINELLTVTNWEMIPGNFSGIMEQDIRKFLRKKKDPQLLATWDYEILYLASLAKLKKEELAQTEFETKEYPRLLWKKSRDAELVGLPNKALSMKISIVKKYPQHPDFDQWTSEISSELTNRKEALAAEKAAAKADAAASGTVTPPAVGRP